MKKSVPPSCLNSPNRFTTVLWLYTTAKALGMRSVPALSAVGLVIALPLVRRILDAVIAKVHPPLREVRRLVRKCPSSLRARITTAANEVIQSLHSVILTGTTLGLVWTILISELVGQIMAELGESARIATDGAVPPEVSFSGEEEFAFFAGSAA